VEHLPLQAELTLPARAPRELRAACDPARPLAPAEQLILHEDLSVAQGGDRIGRIELRVREAWRDSYIRELVTGHAGCGKSTELLRLVAELRKPKQGKAFHVVYLDAYDYLNPHEVHLPQILMALLVALSEEPRWYLKRTRTAPVLWDRVRKILGSLGREVSKDLAETTGLPLLRSLFRVDLSFARGFRKNAQDHIQELLALTRDLITEVTAQLPPEIGGVVFIVDNLEKLPEGETEGGVAPRDLVRSRVAAARASRTLDPHVSHRTQLLVGRVAAAVRECAPDHASDGRRTRKARSCGSW
jgi:energy-coupling factor transporter ATP-binding protein EcfA2